MLSVYLVTYIVDVWIRCPNCVSKAVILHVSDYTSSSLILPWRRRYCMGLMWYVSLKHLLK